MRSGTVKGGGRVDGGPLTLLWDGEVVVTAEVVVDEEEEALRL